MESLVDVTYEEVGDIFILRISGRLDATSSPLLEKKILSFVESGKIRLLLDFEKVEYLSSAGMRLLLSLTKKLKNLDGMVLVSSVTENVLDVIKMAGFDHILKIFDTEEEGIRAFTASN